MAKNKRTKVRTTVSSSADTAHQGMGSVRKSVIFLCVVALIYAAYLVISGQWGAFIESLRTLDNTWVILAMGAYAVYFIFGVLAYVLAVIDDPKSPVGIRDLMSVEATGIFFSNLTPNGTGGAPAQIFRLSRTGLSMGGAGALQYTRFIVYEAGEGIFAALILIFRGGYFIETYGNVFLIGAALFGFKIIEVAALLAVCLAPRLVMRLGNAALRLAKRLVPNKDLSKYRSFLDTQVLEFSRGFSKAARDWRRMLATLVVTLIQLGWQFSLPWFVLKAFGIEADFLTCLACGSMIELLTSAVPLPGGTGGAEGGFAFLFAPMFGSEVAAGFVVWRMVQYFLPVLAAALVMGLRSDSGVSIYTRWRRIRARSKSIWTSIKRKRHTSSNGARINPHRLNHKKSRQRRS